MPAWHEATWVDPDEKQKRRFRGGWLWLLLIPAALVLFSVARFNDYWQYDDMTITTLECDERLGGSPTWADMESAGCAPAAIGATLTLVDAGRGTDPEPDMDGTNWTFKNIPTAFSTLVLNVTVHESVGGVLIVDAEQDPPAVLREMTPSDVARTVFARNLGELDTLTLYVVVYP